jgi:hypothetical protein
MIHPSYEYNLSRHIFIREMKLRRMYHSVIRYYDLLICFLLISISALKRCSVHLYLRLFVGVIMPYLRCLCLLVYSVMCFCFVFLCLQYGHYDATSHLQA